MDQATFVVLFEYIVYGGILLMVLGAIAKAFQDIIS